MYENAVWRSLTATFTEDRSNRQSRNTARTSSCPESQTVTRERRMRQAGQVAGPIVMPTSTHGHPPPAAAHNTLGEASSNQRTVACTRRLFQGRMINIAGTGVAPTSGRVTEATLGVRPRTRTDACRRNTRSPWQASLTPQDHRPRHGQRRCSIRCRPTPFDETHASQSGPSGSTSTPVAIRFANPVSPRHSSRMSSSRSSCASTLHVVPTCSHRWTSHS